MAEAHEEQEADPVEEEGGHEGRAEHEVVPEEGSVPQVILRPVLHNKIFYNTIYIMLMHCIMPSAHSFLMKHMHFCRG